MGLDSSQEIVSHNRRCGEKAKSRNLTFALFDLSHGGSDERFDVVVFSDIARSYRLDSDLVLSAASLVDSGGIFAMVVPSRDQLRFGSLGAQDAGFLEYEIASILREAGLNGHRVRIVMGRMPRVSLKMRFISLRRLTWLSTGPTNGT